MKQKKPTTLTPKLRFPEFRGAGEWKSQRMGDHVTIFKGKGISKADISPSGSLFCIRYGELYTCYGEVITDVVSRTNVSASDLFLSEKHDVIIPASGETKLDIAKASCVVSENIALGGDLNVLRSGLDGPFFSYYLNGPKRFGIAKVAQGVTVIHLYPSQLEQIDIEIPSRPEQEKIASCLSSLDGLLAAHGRKLSALKQHKQGLMQQLFPQENQTQPRLRFPEFRRQVALQVTSLGDVVTFQSGGTPSKHNPAFWNGSIPWVSAKSMKDVLLDDAKDHITHEAIKTGAKQVPAGTVLMLTRGMTLLKDVPVCMLQRPMSFNQDVKALRTKGDLEPRFLLYLLLGYKQRLLNMVGIAGRGTGRFNTEELKSLDIKLPNKTSEAPRATKNRRLPDCPRRPAHRPIAEDRRSPNPQKGPHATAFSVAGGR